MFKKSRRLISILYLCIFLVITSLDTVTVHAEGEANILSTFYAFTQNISQDSVTDEMVESISFEDLRFLSIYASNFYVPWNTDVSAVNSEKIMQPMVNAFVTLGMKEAVAQQLYSHISSMSDSTAKQLYVKSTDLNDAILVTSGGANPLHRYYLYKKNGITNCQVHMDNFTGELFDLTTGGVKDVGGTSYVPMTPFFFYALYNAVTQGAIEEVEFFWLDDTGENAGNPSPVDCFALDATFADIYSTLLNGNVNMANKGYLGNAEFARSGEYAGTVILNATDAAYLHFMARPMYVDWVGNILCDYGDGSFVVSVPAVMNKYVFSDTDNGEHVYISMSTYGLMMLGNTNASGELTLHVEEIEDFIKAYRGTADPITVDFKPGDWGIGTYGKTLQTARKKLSYYLSDAEGHIDYNNLDIRREDHNPTPDMRFDYVSYDTVHEHGLDADVTPLFLGTLNGSVYTFPELANRGYFESKRIETNLQPDSFNAVFQIDDATEQSFVRDMYLTYLYAYAYGQNKIAENIADCPLSYVYQAKCFPKIAEGTTFVWSQIDPTQEDVLDKAYSILDTENDDGYFKRWIKKRLSDIIISWHEDMVGNTEGNTTLGSSTYVGFSGYITIPTLDELTFLAWLISHYNLIMIFLIMIMLVLLFCYVVVGRMELKTALANALLFILFVFLPPIFMNNVITCTNSIADKIYTSKFDYWAITQTQSYLVTFAGVQEDSQNDSTEALKYLNTTSNVVNADLSTSKYSLVKVKWMTPKRVNNINAFVNELTGDNAIADTFDTSGIAYQLAIRAYAEDTRMDAYVENGLYVYRDYFDVFLEALVSYHMFDKQGDGYAIDATLDGTIEEKGKTYNQQLEYSSGDKVALYLAANDGPNIASLTPYIQDTSSLNALGRGFLYAGANGAQLRSRNVYWGYDTRATSMLVNYSNPYISQATKDTELLEHIVDVGSTRKIDFTSPGVISNYLFGYSPKVYKIDGTAIKYESNQNGNVDNKVLRPDICNYIFSLYSETPFYYFRYNITDQVGNTWNDYEFRKYDLDQVIGKNNSRNLASLLMAGNSMYFFNTESTAGDGYGEMRDYMNFHDLFYYIMPILQEGNNAVDLFDTSFGFSNTNKGGITIDDAHNYLYNGTSYTSAYDLIADYDTIWTPEERYNAWHYINMNQLYAYFTPWLYTMNLCEYAKPETIKVMGEDFTIQNPLDPTTYFFVDENNVMHGRYMVFSRSEQKYYGLEDKDLTTVERKLLQVADNVYKDTLRLTNYYTLNDEVLIQAMAMIELFDFNSEFSQTSRFKNSYVLYPQCYELKSFSLDAYLRMILQEATGEPLSTNAESIYTRVLMNSSIFFGVFLLIVDIVCLYIVPLVRFGIIVLMFLLSFMLIIAGALSLTKERGAEDKSKNIVSLGLNYLVKPMLKFMFWTLVLATTVSLLMTEGPSDVTSVGKRVTLSMGDPTMTMIALVILNVFIAIRYCKILFEIVKYTKQLMSMISKDVMGTMEDLAAKGMSNAKHFLGTLGGTAAGAMLASKLGAGNGGGGDSKGSSDSTKSNEQAGKDNTVLKPKATPTGGGSDGNLSADGTTSNSESSGDVMSNLKSRNADRLGSAKEKNDALREQNEAHKTDRHDRLQGKKDAKAEGLNNLAKLTKDGKNSDVYKNARGAMADAGNFSKRASNAHKNTKAKIQDGLKSGGVKGALQGANQARKENKVARQDYKANRKLAHDIGSGKIQRQANRATKAAQKFRDGKDIGTRFGNATTALRTTYNTGRAHLDNLRDTATTVKNNPMQALGYVGKTGVRHTVSGISSVMSSRRQSNLETLAATQQRALNLRYNTNNADYADLANFKRHAGVE